MEAEQNLYMLLLSADWVPLWSPSVSADSVPLSSASVSADSVPLSSSDCPFLNTELCSRTLFLSCWQNYMPKPVVNSKHRLNLHLHNDCTFL